MKNSKTIDEYIQASPETVRPILQNIRQAILRAVPEAVESVSYGMPAFKVNGKPLAYFAVFEKHIGFYPIPSGIKAFRSELAGFKQGKGSVQFPLGKPIPFALIKRIVKFRKSEILA
jgi:uncharacterized protein YdhG (YjbR/CyaY superfamily)